jgi:hypothetical protein
VYVARSVEKARPYDEKALMQEHSIHHPIFSKLDATGLEEQKPILAASSSW